MSAIGSVIVIGLLPFLTEVSRSGRSRDVGGDLRRSCYQLLLVTPGSSPRCAISRRQMRQSPNLRYTECGRPHSVYRKFGLCRICLREMAHRGELPGVTKSSW